MPQEIERQWSEAVLASVAGKTEPGAYVRIDFDTPYNAAVSICPCPDAQGQLVLTLTIPHSLETEKRATYRLGLVSTTGLRRHGQVDYAACLCLEEETVIARFAASLLEPQFLCDTLGEMLKIIKQSIAIALDSPDEDPLTNAETDTDILLQGGLRV